MEKNLWFNSDSVEYILTTEIFHFQLPFYILHYLDPLLYRQCLSKSIRGCNDRSHTIFLLPSTVRQYKMFYRTNINSIIYTCYTAGNELSSLSGAIYFSYTISYLSTYKTTSDENLTWLSLSTERTSSSWNAHNNK